jgi:hypothetical protein
MRGRKGGEEDGKEERYEERKGGSPVDPNFHFRFSDQYFSTGFK